PPERRQQKKTWAFPRRARASRSPRRGRPLPSARLRRLARRARACGARRAGLLASLALSRRLTRRLRPQPRITPAPPPTAERRAVAAPLALHPPPRARSRPDFPNLTDIATRLGETRVDHPKATSRQFDEASPRRPSPRKRAVRSGWRRIQPRARRQHPPKATALRGCRRSRSAAARALRLQSVTPPSPRVP